MPFLSCGNIVPDSPASRFLRVGIPTHDNLALNAFTGLGFNPTEVYHDITFILASKTNGPRQDLTIPTLKVVMEDFVVIIMSFWVLPIHKNGDKRRRKHQAPRQ
jgi:hypothetical protein